MSGLDKDRLRNQTVSFRVSPEERRQLEARIIISGMPKGRYFIESLLHQEIHIVAGKYESDRLSLEFKRLREHIESLQSDNEELTLLLGDCKALLEQLLAVTYSKGNGELSPSDFSTKVLDK